MNAESVINYQRVAKAIEYIHQNFTRQPSLGEVSDYVNLSPFHFQRLFTEWAGTTPKKFLQYVSLQHAKKVLREGQTLFEATYATGLSGSSRLHDLFVKIEGMTPAEFRDGGKNLVINYSYADSPFGSLIVASTPKGICHLAFHNDEEQALAALKVRFPQAALMSRKDAMHEDALAIFKSDWSRLPEIKLHLKGTEFQLKVWACLLTVPMGTLTSYNDIAGRIGHPGASRAVGTAIGSNPVAYLIPCHRVIQSTGALGGYMWGLTRKSAMIGWESCRVENGDPHE